MKLWWRRDIEEAKARADQAEQDRDIAEIRSADADRLREHAIEVGDGLNRELIRNGFSEAVRAAFGAGEAHDLLVSLH